MALPDPGDVFACVYMAGLGWYAGKATVHVAYATCRIARAIIESMRW